MGNATFEYHKLLHYILDNGKKKTDRTGTGTTSIFDYKIKFDMEQGFPLITTKRLHLRSIIHELLWFLKGSTNTKYLNENGVTIWDEWADENGDLGPVYGNQWVNWGSIKETPRIGWLHKREGVWCVKWSDLHSFGEGTHWCYTDISSFNQHKYNDSDEGRKVTFTETLLSHNPETFSPNIVATVSDNPTVSYKGGINQIQNAIDTLKNNPDSRRIMVSAWNVGDIPQPDNRSDDKLYEDYLKQIG
jgi:thymidylate synthase